MKKPNISLHDLLLRAAGVIFLLTMLSLWLVCGLFAKFITEDNSSNSARVAVLGTVEIREHKADLKDVSDKADIGGDFDNMLYKLTDSEVDGNTYDMVLPGVDIPKDTFVRVYSAEVDCELYIEVVNNVSLVYPEAVTYTVTNSWEKVDSASGPHGGDVYKYTGIIGAGSEMQNIDILLNKRLVVSQYYNANDYNKAEMDLSMEFYAWMVQKD